MAAAQSSLPPSTLFFGNRSEAGPFSAAADVGLPFAVLSPINDGFRKSWRRNISRIMLLHLKLEAGREGAYMEVTGRKRVRESY